jgi:hypothetical protein
VVTDLISYRKTVDGKKQMYYRKTFLVMPSCVVFCLRLKVKICVWMGGCGCVDVSACLRTLVWCTKTNRQAVTSLLSKTESVTIKERLDIGRETPVDLFPQDRGRDATLSGSSPVGSHMALKSDTHKYIYISLYAHVCVVVDARVHKNLYFSVQRSL